MMDMESTWRTRFVLVGYCSLAVVTTFVNKHVLSHLHFTYPTIFQSWQTGSAAVALLLISTLGYTNLNIMPLNRAGLISWLPASVLFSGMIYSGSVALSRLPVPLFCAVHYISTFIQMLLESVFLKKDLPLNSQVSLIVTALAVVMVAATDTQFDQTGYKWMMIHCGFSALFVAYGKSRKKNSLSDLDKIFCNAVTSVVILMVISVATNETKRLIEYPHLYSSHFHLWCVASGVSGAALSICRGFLLSTELGSSVGKIKSLNKLAISFLSLFIFDTSLSTNTAISIAVALCSGVFHSYTDTPSKESEKRILIPVRDS